MYVCMYVCMYIHTLMNIIIFIYIIIYRREMKAVDIDTMSWEGFASDHTKWRSALKQHMKTGEYKLMTAAADKRAHRKEDNNSIRPETHDLCNTEASINYRQTYRQRGSLE